MNGITIVVDIIFCYYRSQEVIDVEEEAEEMPPDLRDLSPSEQQFAIKMRALIMMSLVRVCVLREIEKFTTLVFLVYCMYCLLLTCLMFLCL